MTLRERHQWFKILPSSGFAIVLSPFNYAIGPRVECTISKILYYFFVGDIGGTMGLMVGMSLITVVEALDFSLIWLWKRTCRSELPARH